MHEKDTGNIEQKKAVVVPNRNSFFQDCTFKRLTSDVRKNLATTLILGTVACILCACLEAPC